MRGRYARESGSQDILPLNGRFLLPSFDDGLFVAVQDLCQNPLCGEDVMRILLCFDLHLLGGQEDRGGNIGIARGYGLE